MWVETVGSQPPSFSARRGYFLSQWRVVLGELRVAAVLLQRPQEGAHISNKLVQIMLFCAPLVQIPSVFPVKVTALHIEYESMRPVTWIQIKGKPLNSKHNFELN